MQGENIQTWTKKRKVKSVPDREALGRSTPIRGADRVRRTMPELVEESENIWCLSGEEDYYSDESDAFFTTATYLMTMMIMIVN